MHLCTKKLPNMQSKYALKIIKYAFLAKKNNKICTIFFIINHKFISILFYNNIFITQYKNINYKYY